MSDKEHKAFMNGCRYAFEEAARFMEMKRLPEGLEGLLKNPSLMTFVAHMALGRYVAENLDKAG